MYRYSAPIYNIHITPDRREDYLQSLRAAKIERVFLIPQRNFEAGEIKDLALLHENVAWLRTCGISPAIWMGDTIGHGGLLHDPNAQKEGFRPLRNFDGEDQGGTRCPTDERFVENLLKIFRLLAATRPDYILIDDDFRLM